MLRWHHPETYLLLQFFSQILPLASQVVTSQWHLSPQTGSILQTQQSSDPVITFPQLSFNNNTLQVLSWNLSVHSPPEIFDHAEEKLQLASGEEPFAHKLGSSLPEKFRTIVGDIEPPTGVLLSSPSINKVAATEMLPNPKFVVYNRKSTNETKKSMKSVLSSVLADMSIRPGTTKKKTESNQGDMFAGFPVITPRISFGSGLRQGTVASPQTYGYGYGNDNPGTIASPQAYGYGYGNDNPLEPTLTKVMRYWYSPPVGPYFPVATPFYAYVREDAEIGGHVVTVKAVEPMQAVLIYEIVRGNELGHFIIDTATGWISVAAPLDRETVDSYNLSVRAYNYYGHDCVSPVFIRVIDVNDNVPVIRNPTAHFEAPCGVANAHVGTMYATDGDLGRNGQVFYCLDQDHSNVGLFYIDPVSGAVATLTALPPQPNQYTLHITAKDQGTDLQLQTGAEITIYVTCAVYTTAAPALPIRTPIRCQVDTSSRPTTITIATGSTVGSPVATAAVKSANLGPITYSLVSSRDASFFEINPTTGLVRIRMPLTAASVYQLTWQATDGYNTSCMANLVIQTLTTNRPPQFSAPSYSFLVSQCDRAGLPIGAVQARDPDTGVLGQLTFSTTDQFVSVHSTTGVITLSAPVQQSQRPYTFQIATTDGGGLSATAFVTLTVQCSTVALPVPFPPPVFSFTQQSYTFTVPCGNNAARVGQVAVQGANGPVNFVLRNNLGAPFTINAVSGMINVVAILPATPVSYTLVVEATSGRLTATAGVTIQVICPSSGQPPQCPGQPLDASISLLAPPGTPVVTVSAISTSNQPITYSIMEPWSEMFQINIQTGVISVRNPLNQPPPATNTLQIRVRASDSSTQFFCDISVRIQLIVPNTQQTLFLNTTYVFSVECVNVNDFVGSIRARSANNVPNGPITYSLLGANATFFSISQTGDLRTASQLSRPTYSVTVSARDSSGATSQSTVTVNYRCGAPVLPAAVQCQFGGVSFVANASYGVGSIIGTVSAVSSGPVSYSLLTPDAAVLFAIDSRTGTILTRQSLQSLLTQTGGQLAVRQVYFVVRATDTRRNFCDINVVLTVNSVVALTSVPPVFTNSTYRFVVGCSSLQPQTLVGVVQAQDLSSRIPTPLVYELAGPDSSSFSIDRLSGEIRSKVPQLTQQSYILTVDATDSRGLSARVTVLVIIDCPTLSCPASILVSIPEDTQAGTIVGQITPVTDASGQLILYRMASVSILNFVVDPQTGAISLAQPVPPQVINASPSDLNFVITGTEISGQTCNITIKVTINRRNRPPEFVGPPYVFFVNCNQLNSAIGRVTAVSRSRDPQSRITYLISSNERNFSIDPISGEIRYTGNFTQSTYQLQITARDSSGFSSESTASIQIPECPLECPLILRAQIPDDSPRGTLVVTVNILPRRGSNIVFRMVLSGSAVQSQPFIVDPISGAITVNDSLRSLTGQTVRLQITATSDSGQSCSVVPEITVLQRLQAAFLCPSPITLSLRQDVSVGTLISRVSIGGPGGAIYMMTDSGGAGNYFAVDRAGGGVTTIRSLLDLPIRTYTISIRIVTADGSMFCETTVSVNIQPVNRTLQCPSQPVVATLDRSSLTGDPIAIIRVGSPTGSPIQFAFREPLLRIVSLNQTSGLVSLGTSLTNVSGGPLNFVIRATDASGTFCDTTLVINVPPIQNRPPEFLSTLYQFTPTCGPEGSFIGAVSATDPENGPVTYTVLPAESFSVDQTGIIRTRIPLTSSMSDQTLSVSATNNAGLSSTVRVAMTFQRSGCLSPPVCAQPMYRFELVSSAAVGTTVGRVSASDPGGGIVRYSISNNNEQLPFSIDSSSGTIRVLELFGRINQTAFQFTVRASSGNLFCEMTIQITLQVRPAPQFSQNVYSFDVPCGSQARCVGSVVARGTSANIGYTVPSNAFITVESTSGEVCLRGGLTGAEASQTTVVAATDLSAGGSATVMVTLNFQPCRRPPACSPTFLSTAINEADPIGTLVQQVSATDPDVGDVLTYSLTSGNRNETFSMNAQSGIISLNKPLDRETTSSYRLSAVVRDSTGLLCDVVIDVAIIDTNDNIPVFASSTYTFTAECQRAFAFVGTVLATDADVGLNARVTYSVAANSPFTVNAETGELRTRVPLDGEQSGRYIVTVSASDAGSPQRTSTAIVNVQVNCSFANPPICPPPSSIQLRENTAINTPVTQVTSLDANNGSLPLQYLLSGYGADRFRISSTGQILVVGNLDRETSLNPFSLSIQVGNSVGLSCQTLLTITLTDENDNTPIFTGGRNFTVDCGVRNAPVGYVSAGDSDTGQNAVIEYTLLGSSEFEIDRQTGEIRTQSGLTSVPQIREIIVSSNDLGTPRRSSQTTVVVTVRQNCPSAPLLCRERYTATIRDDVDLGSEVVTVGPSASTSSLPQPIVYSFTRGNEQGLFLLNQQSGRITVLRSLLPGSNELMVELRSGTQFCTTVVLVTVADINDNSPIFTQNGYTFIVNCGVLGSAGRVTATDMDRGTNGFVTYTLSGSEVFVVDPRSGEIRSVRPLSSLPSVYQLTITASDGGSPVRTATAAVIINVQCVVATTLSPSQPLTARTMWPSTLECAETVVAEVQENQSGLVISNIISRDPSYPNAVLSYILLPSTDSQSFRLDGDNSGRLIVRTPLDRESQSTYFVTIRAASPYGQSCDIVVRINVVDANDNPPVFAQTVYRFSLDCISQGPYLAGSVSATDLDIGMNAMIAYRIQNDQYFTVNPTTGAISLPAAISAPFNPVRTIVIMATNPVLPLQSSSATVQIALGSNCYVSNLVTSTPINFPTTTTARITPAALMTNSPQCIGLRGAANGVTIRENSPVGTIIGTFDAVDRDANDRLTFRVGSGDADNGFFLDPESGELRVSGRLDRETRESYNLTIIVTDSTGYFCSLPVFIRITDQNDNLPEVLNMQPLVASVNCSVPNAFVVRILAADRDLEQNAALTYSVDTRSGFQISQNGEVRTLAGLDRDPPARFLPVIIADQGIPSLSITVTLTVNVMCQTQSPTFDQQYYCAGIQENNPPNAEITRVTARYPDQRTNVNYVIRSGNTAFFSVDAQTGIIRSRTSLDAEIALGDNSLVIGTLQNNKTTPDAYAVVFVNILDENDHTPRFTQLYQTTAMSAMPLNSAVIRVRATDDDRTYPNNFILNYALADSGTAQQYFRIDASGELVLSRPLTPLQGQTLSIRVVAVDGGTPQRSGTTTVALTVV